MLSKLKILKWLPIFLLLYVAFSELNRPANWLSPHERSVVLTLAIEIPDETQPSGYSPRFSGFSSHFETHYKHIPNELKRVIFNAYVCVKNDWNKPSDCEIYYRSTWQALKSWTRRFIKL